MVIPPQDEIRIYENNDGCISILQDDGIGNEQLVWFAPQHADALCDAIQRLAKQMLDDAAPETTVNA
jgi:hypothetical protein